MTRDILLDFINNQLDEWVKEISVEDAEKLGEQILLLILYALNDDFSQTEGSLKSENLQKLIDFFSKFDVNLFFKSPGDSETASIILKIVNSKQLPVLLSLSKALEDKETEGKFELTKESAKEFLDGIKELNVNLLDFLPRSPQFNDTFNLLIADAIQSSSEPERLQELNQKPIGDYLKLFQYGENVHVIGKTNFTQQKLKINKAAEQEEMKTETISIPSNQDKAYKSLFFYNPNDMASAIFLAEYLKEQAKKSCKCVYIELPLITLLSFKRAYRTQDFTEIDDLFKHMHEQIDSVFDKDPTQFKKLGLTKTFSHQQLDIMFLLTQTAFENNMQVFPISAPIVYPGMTKLDSIRLVGKLDEYVHFAAEAILAFNTYLDSDSQFTAVLSPALLTICSPSYLDIPSTMVMNTQDYEKSKVKTLMRHRGEETTRDITFLHEIGGLYREDKVSKITLINAKKTTEASTHSPVELEGLNKVMYIMSQLYFQKMKGKRTVSDSLNTYIILTQLTQEEVDELTNKSTPLQSLIHDVIAEAAQLETTLPNPLPPLRGTPLGNKFGLLPLIPDQALNEAFKQKNGVIFLHRHDDIESYQALIAFLMQLSKQRDRTINHLYLEVSKEAQPFFEEFNKSGDITPIKLLFEESTFIIEDAKIYLLWLIQAAHHANIAVFPVDDTGQRFYSIREKDIETFNQNLTDSNSQICQNIQALSGNESNFIGLFGLLHYEVANQLGVMNWAFVPTNNLENAALVNLNTAFQELTNPSTTEEEKFILTLALLSKQFAEVIPTREIAPMKGVGQYYKVG